MNLADQILVWFMDNVMPWLLIALVLLLVVGVPLGIYAEATAEKFSLRKDQWTCSRSVERSTTTYVNTGSVMVPITSYHKHCTQWSEAA